MRDINKYVNNIFSSFGSKQSIFLRSFYLYCRFIEIFPPKCICQVLYLVYPADLLNTHREKCAKESSDPRVSRSPLTMQSRGVSWNEVINWSFPSGTRFFYLASFLKTATGDIEDTMTLWDNDIMILIMNRASLIAVTV